jgi:hypothetical protein
MLYLPKDGAKDGAKDGWSRMLSGSDLGRNSSLSPPLLFSFGRDFFNETADFGLAAKMVQTTGLDL